jgi:SET domain-containing protein
MHSKSTPLLKVRKSRVHGQGVFALRKLRKGTRLIEYVGDRISHEEADARYEVKDEWDNHTFLYIVDKKTVIDAGVGGNEARFINHSCDGNCETIIEAKRLYIEARRTIQPGEELCYDYQIQREASDPPNVDEVYACRCGSAKCRGSMLWPPKRKSAAAKAGTKGRSKSKSKPKPKPKPKSKPKSKSKSASKPRV